MSSSVEGSEWLVLQTGTRSRPSRASVALLDFVPAGRSMRRTDSRGQEPRSPGLMESR
jgi:hypothetical protein